MSTKYPEIFAALAAPFGDVKIRETDDGRALSYITARQVMNHLDMILGPENWWDRYKVVSSSAVLCHLTIRLPDKSTVSKADLGSCAEMDDPGDAEKSGASDALKRAAVKFGIGRHLYGEGVASFDVDAAEPRPQSRRPEPQSAPRANGYNGNGNGNGNGHTNRLPPQQQRPSNGNGYSNGRSSGAGRVPQSGRALFGWLKDQDLDNEIASLKYIVDWGKLQGFPRQVTEWTSDQTAAAIAEFERRFATS